MTGNKAMDFAVLKKFNTQGPRYTSYPTAPVFSNKFTDEDFLSEIRDTNDPGTTRPLSLYFHFPFCAKLCYFCGCNMKVSNDRAVIAEYNDYIKREIDMVSPMIAHSRKVTQM
ncbi:MAG: coproporphyrinogen III oxidase, partial [Acidobacteria bacterium]|nr:coproporphyrinogen III oxidase [Acidobacteriota bacterium]